MKNQEASEDTTKRKKNSILSPNTSFMKENTQKDEEKGENVRPSSVGTLRCVLHAPGCEKLRSHAPKCHSTSSTRASAGGNNFLLSLSCMFEEKAQFFSLNLLGNQPINTTSPIHNYWFKTKRFKRQESNSSFKGGVSLLNLSLQGMFDFFTLIG